MTTVAGATFVFRGDGGPATNAPLGEIWGVVTDASGNLYASDTGNQLVVRIAPSGLLTIVAGNGSWGFSGDGGPARSAAMRVPRKIAFDRAGNFYIPDTNNHRVRRVTPAGVISTVAGTGVAGFSGDGGPATQAQLRQPWAVAVDGQDNLYVADYQNLRIRKVTSQGVISTVAGDGVARFNGDAQPATAASLNWPEDVAFDSAGRLLIADVRNHRVRRVDFSTGMISTVAGSGDCCFFGDNGPATSANMQTPAGVTSDAEGNIWIADALSHRVRRVNPAGVITTVAGNGSQLFAGDGFPATAAALSNPISVAVDAAGVLYISDRDNYRVRAVSRSGIISTVAGNGAFRYGGDNGPATAAFLNEVNTVAVDRDGNLLIAEGQGNRVRMVAPNGIITTVAGTGLGGFSGDGGPAANAFLNNPSGLALTPDGGFYISDRQNGRIRYISPQRAISTVAGGTSGFLGDNGPAALATFRNPNGLAVDAAGNLYIADTDNHRIRKITRTSGIITTVAGNGTAGFSGDSGSATAAQLNGPLGVGVDPTGALFIADTGNHRIRKVTAGGTISTVAGNGTGAFAGDGGQAVQASLKSPSNLLVHTDGTLWIADRDNFSIRKVDAAGVISTPVGVGGQQGFSGDGDAADKARFCGPTGLAFDAAGNLFIADRCNQRVRAVLATAPSFAVTPDSLSASATAGTQGAPLSLTVLSAVASLKWTARAFTQTGGNWLTVIPTAGAVPGAIEARLDARALVPAEYTGTITVESPVSVPTQRTVAVRLTVAPPPPASLAVEPRSLFFEAAAGGADPPFGRVFIRNTGGGSLAWTAVPSTAAGGNWLTVSTPGGTATSSAPSELLVLARAAGLGPGVYSGSVRVASAAIDQAADIAITLVLSTTEQKLLLSQSGLTFIGVERGAEVPGDTFGVLNIGRGVMNWTAKASTVAGGDWLSVSRASGTSVADSSAVPLVDVVVNSRGLRTGVYTGVVRIDAPGAANSPQLVTALLQMLPAGSTPPFVVRPTGLIFVRQAGTSDPGSQTVRISTAAPGAFQAVRGTLTSSGGNWLDASPEGLSVSAVQPGVLTVQPALGALGPDEYFGTVTVLFNNNTVQNVVVLFVVTPAGATASSFDEGRAANGCTPQRLYLTVTTLGSSFAASTGYPATLGARVRDDCDNPVTNAGVLATFNTLDPPLVLVSLNNGEYWGTWRPARPAAQVEITCRASAGALESAIVRVQGQVGAATTVPTMYPTGVVNAASFATGQPLAPGSIISIFGERMAEATPEAASRLPLPTRLAVAGVNVGGRDLPLFYASAGQINAQVPFDMTPGSRPQAYVRVSAGGADSISVPETLTVTPVAPGIFQTGVARQGVVTNPQGQLVDTRAPAAAGDIMIVYATGLGLTDRTVATGEAAPSDPAAKVTVPVEARVGGIAATVQFAGLAPGFAGLYQINLQIPAGVAPGPAVELTLIQAGVSSNTVTIALR